MIGAIQILLNELETMVDGSSGDSSTTTTTTSPAPTGTPHSQLSLIGELIEISLLFCYLQVLDTLVVS